jgi:hypothetical protein
MAAFWAFLGLMPTWASAQLAPQPCNASVLCHPSYAAQGQSVVRIRAGLNNGTGLLIRNPVPGGNPFIPTALPRLLLCQ